MELAKELDLLAEKAGPRAMPTLALPHTVSRRPSRSRRVSSSRNATIITHGRDVRRCGLQGSVMLCSSDAKPWLDYEPTVAGVGDYLDRP